MLKDSNKRPWMLLGSVFLFFTLLFIILKVLGADLHLDFSVVIFGNLILFVATTISFALYSKSLRNNKPAYILRMVYGALFAKMMICLAAALVYIFIKRSAVDKSALFICFGLYFIYTFVELRVLMQLSKEQKNA